MRRVEQITRTPEDTGVDYSVPAPIICPLVVTDLLTDEQADGSGAGTCSYVIVEAKLLIWDNINICWTEGMTVWLFEQNNAELSVGTRYDAMMLSHSFEPAGGSGSGNGERPLFKILGSGVSDGSGSGGTTKVYIDLIDCIRDDSSSDSERGSGDESGSPAEGDGGVGSPIGLLLALTLAA